MSYLRGRGGENRRSVFYTGSSNAEEWELVDAPPKDLTEQKPPDTHRRRSPLCCSHGHKIVSNLTNLSLLFQIPSDRLLISTLCATPRDPRGSRAETRWAPGSCGVPRAHRWSLMAAKFRTWVSRGNGRSSAACSRNRPNSGRSWPHRRCRCLSGGEKTTQIQMCLSSVRLQLVCSRSLCVTPTSIY